MVGSSRRQPLTERSDSESNTVRLIQNTPPRLPTQPLRHTASSSSIVEQRIRSLLEQQQSSSSTSSSVFPTLPSQVLSPPASNTTHQLFQGYALQDTPDDVSRPARTTDLQPPTGSSASIAPTHQPPPDSDSLFGQRPKTPRSSKKLKHVEVRADKTFSVLDSTQLDPSQYPSDWQKTPTKSPKLQASQRSHEELSSYPTENDSPTKSSNSCTQPPRPRTSIATSATPVTLTQTGKPSIPGDNNNTPLSTPTDYTKDPELVGGIRLVPKTPDSKKEDSPATRTLVSVPPLPSAPNTSIDEASAASRISSVLTTKPSNISAISETPTDTENYITFGNKSSSESESSTIVRHPIYPTSPADSGNYQLIGENTPSASSSIHAPSESHNSNYEVYGTPSGSASPSASSLALVPRPSQDSLAVPSLRLKATRSRDKFGYYKSRSRESLRTATSLASISSVLAQEAERAALRSSAVENLPPPSSFAIPGSWAEQALSRRYSMQAHPHQWSSQLSTVHSESERATDRGSGNFSSGRRSSGFASYGSRQYRGSGGSFGSLERPQPTYARNGQRDTTGSTIRMVGDQDEHGDHLTDMQDLRARPSRSRSGLSFFSSSSSDNGRRNSTQSSTSSRANSLLVSTIPAWARLYYGSGERRWLAGAPGSSTEGSDSRPVSPITLTGSPVTDNFPLNIYSPRRRPREANPNPSPLSPLRRSLEIAHAEQFDSQGNLIQDNQNGLYRRPSRRWRTSSIWSPHLRLDRRATRLSAWQPPSFSWSTEGTWTGRRNAQIVMFTIGFIFPFAWMIAAFLPLPPIPVFVMQERGSEYDVEWSPSHPDLVGLAEQNFRQIDEARYESAKWWRRLNRYMSFIGILIIGTVIALVIVGIRDWSKM